MTAPDRSALIVDDEPASRELLDIILSEAGYGTVCVAGGAEALDRLADRRFDVVVSDLQMPGMDGLELTQEIRRRSPQMEVLILTAFGSQAASPSTTRSNPRVPRRKDGINMAPPLLGCDGGESENRSRIQACQLVGYEVMEFSEQNHNLS